jgi:hemerythrin-like domain-containing protein
MNDPDPTRRTALAAALLLAGCGATAADRATMNKAAPDEVTPNEDLMREHGVLLRVLCIYDEAVLRLDAGKDVPIDALSAAAQMFRKFGEDYHEKQEEQQLFPRFRVQHRLVSLVDTLRDQHEAGRRLTDLILRLTSTALGDASRHQLATTLAQFTRMYRAHIAREDTVLFPELHAIVSRQEYAEIGEKFEIAERQLVGDQGFEHAVIQVAELERAFGIDDLAALTPA